jgi:hypothetical protein
MLEVEPAFRGDLTHAPVRFLARPGDLHHLQRLGDDVAHGHARRKRGIGVLKDQLRALAVILELLLRDPFQVVFDLTIRIMRVAARDRHRLQKRPAQRRLSRAAFANESEETALVDVDRHVVHRLQGETIEQTLAHPKTDGKVFRPDQRIGHSATSR